jgi:tRNA-splicing ligase RtcB
MNKRELLKLGLPHGPVIEYAKVACEKAAASGQKKRGIREALTSLAANPAAYVDDPIYGELARQIVSRPPGEECYSLQGDLKYAVWGQDIDASAHDQMKNACRLPVTVAAALMPDAHVGYGLPIGGVLATENAVIPYAVGVDIACRVKMSVFDLPPSELESSPARYENILERDTRFGVGGNWRPGDRPDHPVMDEDWRVTQLTANLKDLGWSQLGTSGSGNHFVEFGEIEFFADNPVGVAPGTYLAVVSHSGSRGSGAKTCEYYSRVARELHPNLPRELSYLAWLPLNGAGGEYWAAMELMGKYASANHDVIHRKIARSVGAPLVYQIENHHNFAWKETHQGRELIVHRKGATPAGRGVIGYIPGSMTAPGYLVEGLGDPASLGSASHGAGRRMSRTKARETTRWSHLRSVLQERGVRLISAGLDESPHAYKDIDAVMQAQRELVRPIARFQPKLVKMAPDGEKPED